MNSSSIFMWRCLELARKGKGQVEPNPMVGALLVNENTIIGEGYHMGFGKAHAEVNAISDAIQKGNEALIESSTLYVTLEPCSHTGKTPPCADLIIKSKIPRVRIGCPDPNPQVNGKGIIKLKKAGIDVGIETEAAIKNAAEELIRPFSRPINQKRPYIILKWAETADGFIGSANGERLKISNEFSDRLVHKWRSEQKAILVGRNTAELDDPYLTNRYWPGSSPLRMVVDPELKLSNSLKLFNGESPLTIFNYLRSEKISQDLNYVKMERGRSMVKQLLDHLYEEGIPSIFVEGGAALLTSFIQEGSWDEARIIQSQRQIVNGIPAPVLTEYAHEKTINCLNDRIDFYYRK